MKVKSESEVAQSCPTPSDPMDCSLPGPSVHGIFQARVLEWVAIAFSVVFAYVALNPSLRRQKECPLASVSNGVIYFLISYYSESKECLEVVRTLLGPLP